MKYLLLVLLTTNSFAKEERYTGIIHNYIFLESTRLCSSHRGLHYIVSDMKVNKNKHNQCVNIIKVRCQDTTIHQINDSIAYCSVPKIQIKEVLK